MALAVTDIVNQLIQAHIQKKDVNLNSIKGKSASKYGLASQPRLVDIIATVPQQYKKKTLVPKLKANLSVQLVVLQLLLLCANLIVVHIFL